MSRITSLLASVALFCLGISVPHASANPIAVSGGSIWATGSQRQVRRHLPDFRASPSSAA